MRPITLINSSNLLWKAIMLSDCGVSYGDFSFVEMTNWTYFDCRVSCGDVLRLFAIARVSVEMTNWEEK
ncbi:MAG: hypothetical protein ABI850_10105 [Flavobacterium sp.]